MQDDHPPTGSDSPGWLERLGNAFTGNEPEDREDLIDTLRGAYKRNLLDANALSMIEGALQVSDMKVRDIMIPRPQIITLNDDDSLQDMLKVVIESGHSRFPVMSEKKDKVVGILLAKDLLRYFQGDSAPAFVLSDVLRPPEIVPESIRLNDLLNDFRENRNHMAIVVDEYGTTSGLASIEDVLEQIVGEIDDEHDTEEEDHAILLKGDNVYTIKALTPIDDFNEYFKTTLDDADVDTVGGLLAKHLGHLPKSGESALVEKFNFTVIKADGRRVHLLEMQVA